MISTTNLERVQPGSRAHRALPLAGALLALAHLVGCSGAHSGPTAESFGDVHPESVPEIWAPGWTMKGDLIPLDVGVGANGDTWIIDDSYNDTVYKWLNGGGWQLSEVEHASRLSVGPAGDPWVVDSQNRILHLVNSNGSAVQVPGPAATDIGVGANGDVWIIGAHPNTPDAAIYKYLASSNTWQLVPGGAVRIAVGPLGDPWIVNSVNQLFHRVGDFWQAQSQTARDVGVGANGEVWVVAADLADGLGNVVNVTRPAGSQPVSTASFPIPHLAKGASSIAVAPNGRPWIVATGPWNFLLSANCGGQIAPGQGLPANATMQSCDGEYALPAPDWLTIPGGAVDIGVGANGDIWAIGDPANATDRHIYKYVPAANGWQLIDGAAVRIAVGPAGDPWVVNSSGAIYRRVNNAWVGISGSATDIAVGANGDVWAIGGLAGATDGHVYKYNPSNNSWTDTWTDSGSKAVRIAVGPGGDPWVVTSLGAIFHQPVGLGWQQEGAGLGIGASDIGIGANGEVWFVGNDVASGGGNVFDLVAPSGGRLVPAMLFPLPAIAALGATSVSVAPDGRPWITTGAPDTAILASSCGQLYPSQPLTAGGAIQSCDGRYTLVLQSFGNLMLYRNDTGVIVWTTPSGGPGSRLQMQTDGNLVFTDGNGAQLWNTGTGGHSGNAVAQVTGDGRVTISVNGTLLAWIYAGSEQTALIGHP